MIKQEKNNQTITLIRIQAKKIAQHSQFDLNLRISRFS